MSDSYRESAKGSLSAKELVDFGKKCNISPTDICQEAAEAGGTVVTEKTYYEKSPNSVRASIAAIVALIIATCFSGVLVFQNKEFENGLKSKNSYIKYFYKQATLLAKKNNHLTTQLQKERGEVLSIPPTKIKILDYLSSWASGADYVRSAEDVSYTTQNKKDKKLQYGEICKLHSKATIESLGKYKDDMLVYYVCSDKCSVIDGYCPNKITVWLSERQFELIKEGNSRRAFEEKQQRAKRAFVRKVLKSSIVKEVNVKEKNTRTGGFKCIIDP